MQSFYISGGATYEIEGIRSQAKGWAVGKGRAWVLGRCMPYRKTTLKHVATVLEKWLIINLSNYAYCTNNQTMI